MNETAKEQREPEADEATAADDSMDEARADGPAESPAAEAENAATVEALLFATDAPLTPAKIAQIAELPGLRAVRQAIAALNERYERMGCAFHVEAIAGGYQLMTRPEYHDVVSRLHKARGDSKLSQAAMETLAIIAYRQPIMRADVESIRGVACGEVLRGLMEKQLVKIVGRAEVLGRPMLYGTTRRFLEVFGLNDLADLPRVEELRSGASAEKPAAATGEKTAPADENTPPADGEKTPAPAPETVENTPENSPAEGEK
ncbi:MAG TPA: SMC-Scp complex subunit ScpB [Phycisphaerae bacterium]|nr:SMC-Scp complex subunit ScpB [Phycisphaerae bacterium]